MEIKPGIGISILIFGKSMADAEKVFGKAEEIVLMDDIEGFQSTVWHFWKKGFSLFFDEQKNQQFYFVEINNPETELWGQKIFDLTEKQLIELFKAKGIKLSETEKHEWGEKMNQLRPVKP